LGNVEMIGMEEHVDYWNGLGWNDPYSSAAWSERQRVYSGAMDRSNVYTPQAVVDGQFEVVGSDREGLLEIIAEAAKKPKARVVLSRDGDTLRIAISELPAPAVEADVLLVMTEEGLSTAVTRGENKGLTMAHAPIARSMEAIGVISANEPVFTATRPVASAAKKRAVVMVQARGTKAILGAGAVLLGG